MSLTREQFSQLCLKFAGFFVIAAVFFLPLSITGKTIAILLALFCIFCSGHWREKFEQIRNNPVALSALMLLLMFLIGVFYSEASTKESLDIFKKYTRLLYVALFMPIFIANPKLVKYLLHAFIVSSLFVVVSGFLSVYGWVDIAALFHRSAHNAQFPFMISDFLLALSIFFLAHLFWENKTHWRWFYLISFILIAYYDLIVSNKRTGYVTLVILAIVFFWQRLSRKQFLTGMMILCFLVVGLFTFSNNFKQGVTEIYQSVSSIKEGNHVLTSTGLRAIFVEKSFELWQQKPILGYGTGSFKHVYLELGGPNAEAAPVSEVVPLTTPHNEYANIAVQLGLVGLLMFLFFLAVAFFAASYLPRLYRFCAQGLLLAFIFGNFSGSYLFYSTQGDLFVIFCAALFSQLALRHTEQVSLTSPLVRRL